jgi:hypothetical protein
MKDVKRFVLALLGKVPMVKDLPVDENNVCGEMFIGRLYGVIHGAKFAHDSAGRMSVKFHGDFVARPADGEEVHAPVAVFPGELEDELLRSWYSADRDTFYFSADFIAVNAGNKRAEVISRFVVEPMRPQIMGDLIKHADAQFPRWALTPTLGDALTAGDNGGAPSTDKATPKASGKKSK